MSESNAYSVVVTGEVPEDLRKDDVVAAFAKVFKVDEEKAGLYFQGKPRLLRRNLDSAGAETYTKVLTQIGIPFELMLEETESAEEASKPAAAEDKVVPLATAANDGVEVEASAESTAADAPAESPKADAIGLVPMEEESKTEQRAHHDLPQVPDLPAAVRGV